MFKARVLVSRKDMPRVLKFYEHYLDNYPRANNMRLGYARHLVDLKQWDKAREQFKRVAAETPRDAEVVFTIALLALQSNELDEAERYLKRTLEVQPENDQARLYLGQVAEQRKQYADAIQWYSSIESAENALRGAGTTGCGTGPARQLSNRHALICTICCPRPKPRKCSWRSPRSRCCATRSSMPRHSTR